MIRPAVRHRLRNRPLVRATAIIPPSPPESQMRCQPHRRTRYATRPEERPDSSGVFFEPRSVRRGHPAYPVMQPTCPFETAPSETAPRPSPAASAATGTRCRRKRRGNGSGRHFACWGQRGYDGPGAENTRNELRPLQHAPPSREILLPRVRGAGAIELPSLRRAGRCGVSLLPGLRRRSLRPGHGAAAASRKPAGCATGRATRWRGAAGRRRVRAPARGHALHAR